jgi:hypothetical protein
LRRSPFNFEPNGITRRGLEQLNRAFESGGFLQYLSTLSGALKISDKITVSMEAVGNKIRLN